MIIYVYGIERSEGIGRDYSSTIETKLYTSKEEAEKRIAELSKQIKDDYELGKECINCNVEIDIDEILERDDSFMFDADDIIRSVKQCYPCKMCSPYINESHTDYGCKNDKSREYFSNEHEPKLIEFELDLRM